MYEPNELEIILEELMEADDAQTFNELKEGIRLKKTMLVGILWI